MRRSKLDFLRHVLPLLDRRLVDCEPTYVSGSLKCATRLCELVFTSSVRRARVSVTFGLCMQLRYFAAQGFYLASCALGFLVQLLRLLRVRREAFVGLCELLLPNRANSRIGIHRGAENAPRWRRSVSHRNPDPFRVALLALGRAGSSYWRRSRRRRKRASMQEAEEAPASRNSKISRPHFPFSSPRRESSRPPFPQERLKLHACAHAQGDGQRRKVQA